MVCCGGCGSGGPEATVAALHEAWQRGDRAAAHALVDYDYRLAEVLGPVWERGTAEDRKDSVAQAQAMFEKTTETLWKTHYEGRPRTTRVTEQTAPHVWVESLVTQQPSFRWRYRLTEREAGWRITQREYVLPVGGSNTSAFYPMAVKRLTADLGRAPSLAELNANLPSLAGQMRARTFKVPELKDARGRRPRQTSP